MGDRNSAYRVLVGKPKGKRPLRRPRRRWVSNIKMGLRELEWGRGLVSSASGYRQVLGCCGHGNELSDSTKFREFPE
jgi:hypothetical protein